MIPTTLPWYSPLFFFFFDVLDWKCSEALHPPGWQACSLYTTVWSSICRLFGPACGGLSVYVGKAGEMLRVFVLWVPAWAQWRVHVPRGGIAGWMHRWAGVTAVSWRHIWPPRSNRCRVQPRSAAHQARLHSRHLAVELILWKRRRRRGCYGDASATCTVKSLAESFAWLWEEILQLINSFLLPSVLTINQLLVNPPYITTGYEGGINVLRNLIFIVSSGSCTVSGLDRELAPEANTGAIDRDRPG